MTASPALTPAPCDRRTFLKLASAAGTLHAAASPQPTRTVPVRPRIVDVNVHLSRWPLRRLACDETPVLVDALQRHRTAQAWTGTLDGLLHKDLGAANTRLAHECRTRGRGILVPFGSINPALPGWESELHRCARQLRMPGIRLHPNYHAYALDDPRFAQLLQLAAELRVIVQIALVMEDERMMHPRFRVEPVNPEPLLSLIPRVPGLRLVLLNALRTVRGPLLPRLLAAGNVSVDIAMLEGMAGIENLLTLAPIDRLLLGTHAPLFYVESAHLKLMESVLTWPQLQAICSANASRLLDGSGNPR